MEPGKNLKVHKCDKVWMF